MHRNKIKITLAHDIFKMAAMTGCYKNFTIISFLFLIIQPFLLRHIYLLMFVFFQQNYRGGYRISGKWVHMCKGVGVRTVTKFFIFIGYLKTGAGRGFERTPETPLDPPLNYFRENLSLCFATGQAQTSQFI